MNKMRVLAAVGVIGVICLAVLIAVAVTASTDQDSGASKTCNVVFVVGSVQGELTLTQEHEHSPVFIKGTLRNLTEGYHGFHVHDTGNISGGCGSTGGHFNPEKVDHGAPEDKIRHVGDLGNVKVGADGSVTLDLSDHMISLQGKNSIIGRAFVVHADEDDLGKGGFTDSKKTGHAGARLGCGIVAIAA